MESVAYVINTTPKYFYLLPLHLTCLFRYSAVSPAVSPVVFLATEAPDHPDITALCTAFPQLQILPLTHANDGFFESRAAACAEPLAVALHAQSELGAGVVLDHGHMFVGGGVVHRYWTVSLADPPKARWVGDTA